MQAAINSRGDLDLYKDLFLIQMYRLFYLIYSVFIATSLISLVIFVPSSGHVPSSLANASEIRCFLLLLIALIYLQVFLAFLEQLEKQVVGIFVADSRSLSPTVLQVDILLHF